MVKQTLDSISLFKDTCAGRKALIIGSGPSLDHADLSAYNGHIWFAVGQSPVAIDRCDYYCFTDGSTIEASFWERARAISGKCIGFGKDFLGHVGDDITILPRIPTITKFSADDQGITWGVDVGHPTVHLAYLMGIRDVTLIGIDYKYDRGHKYCQSKVRGGEPQWGRNVTAMVRGSRLDGQDDPIFGPSIDLWHRIINDNTDLKITVPSEFSVLHGVYNGQV